MTEKQNCPVSNELCIARMDTVKAQIDGIKDTIIASVTVMGVALAVIEIVLKVL